MNRPNVGLWRVDNMYSMNGLGAISDAEVVRNAIRRARGSSYGGWQPSETSELQRTLNSMLIPLGYQRIPESGVYDGRTFCAAVEAIFGRGTPTTKSLQNEIGSVCMGSYAPLPRTGSSSSMAQESLIIFDDDEATPSQVPTAPQSPDRRLSDFCNVPPGLCAENAQLAASIRAAASASCDYYMRFEGPRPPQVKGLGGIDCSPPGTNRITFSNFRVFLQNYDPCQLKNIQVCPPPPPTPFVPCKLGSGACIDSRSPDILDTAETQCQFNVTPRGDSAACPNPNGVVTHSSAHRFSPCELAKLPMCGELDMEIPIPFSPQQAAEEEEEEEDDNTKFIVGGLLGLLVVGGVAYAATRKRKKGKRRK